MPYDHLHTGARWASKYGGCIMLTVAGVDCCSQMECEVPTPEDGKRVLPLVRQGIRAEQAKWRSAKIA